MLLQTAFNLKLRTVYFWNFPFNYFQTIVETCIKAQKGQPWIWGDYSEMGLRFLPSAFHKKITYLCLSGLLYPFSACFLSCHLHVKIFSEHMGCYSEKLTD
jgi:hypothetical protein